MARRILILDTTLRDGEQSPGASLTKNDKLLIAKQLSKLGVDIIEAGFPAASQGDFDSVKIIAQQVDGPIICGLCRAVDSDIDRCWEALKYSKHPRIHTFVATSDIHIEDKLRKDKGEIIRMAVSAVKRARSYCDDVQFACEDAARTDLDYMCDVVKAAIAAGATTINIPDTVGYSQPEEFAHRITYLMQKVPETRNIVISVHCHNDLGNAVANSLIAIKSGACQVECCINGIGERAGNAATEEIIMNLVNRSDYFDAVISANPKEIFNTSRLVSNLTWIPISRNKAIVGKNAFAHASGIHQHGILQNAKTYEIMSPDDVGWHGDRLVISKHSGKHALNAYVRNLGYDLSETQLDQLTKKVKELADKNKQVENDDVVAIANDITDQPQIQKIKLDEFLVATGSATLPCASVKLSVNGETKSGVGTGVGPVDALCSAISTIVGPSFRLTEYNLSAITGGTNALADVSVKIEDANGTPFSARGVNEDIIKASAEALIKSLNKAFEK